PDASEILSVLHIPYSFCFIFTIISLSFIFFFFNVTPTTEIYTLSLHDALPIYRSWRDRSRVHFDALDYEHSTDCAAPNGRRSSRSEEHTSELQSRFDLVCRLLLEKKKERLRCRSR